MLNCPQDASKMLKFARIEILIASKPRGIYPGGIRQPSQQAAKEAPH